MKVRPKRIQQSIDRGSKKRILHMQATRLATMDFYYGINPERTAVVCRVDEKTAVKLRKHPVYKAVFDNLELEMNSTVKKDMSKESEKLKMAMASLVPDAIEKLRSQLEDVGLVGLQAAREVLDRDGRMPKVSRVQSTIENQVGIPDVSDSLLKEFGESKPN